MEDAHIKGDAILETLTDASLLEKCYGFAANCVKLHDVVRDLVLAMTSPKSRGVLTHGDSWNFHIEDARG